MSDFTRRNFLRTSMAGLAIPSLANVLPHDQDETPKNKSAMGLKVAPLERVRAAFIGVGARGSGHVGHMLTLDGVEIKAICDTHEPTAKRSQARCVKAGHKAPDIYTKGDHDYRRMFERGDIDIVIIATPWSWHAPQAVEAMEAGIHAFIEVPAALTVKECWQLVDTSERTQKHCMMLENVCYGREELMVLNMCRKGLFGELTHGEAAYIHDLRFQMKEIERGTGSWRTGHHTKRDGNIYPTHGLGPVSQYMNINRGDRFDYLTSMSSPALGRAAFAKSTFPADHQRNKATYRCGDMNTTLIKTKLGRSVLVQHDTTTPRPYNRLNLIQGTKGTFGGFPGRITVEGRGNTHGWQDLKPFREEFEHPLWKRMGEVAKKAGGHGGMDFIMLWRLVYCLRHGEAMDQDVYDCAAWTAVSPLSEASVANRSGSVDFPDFTRGKWKDAKPLAIIS
ncbi:MAG: hypothetical protein ACI97A_002865 [Planctomycetota bacterium]|jgi:hypothetical protein